MNEKRPKLLLVDDKPANLLALEAVLGDSEFDLIRAASGPQALELIQQHEFALVLLDIQMPDMDGFETARRIKQRERTRGVPIVFLTAADADGHLALRGYAAGAVDYLTKPIDPWVLRAKVAVLVELWEKNRKVRDQAALTAAYERRLTQAATRVEQALRLAGGTNHELKVMLEQLAEDLQ